MSAIEAVLIGAGQRGMGNVGGYALANPDKLKFIAIAEQDEGRRNKFAELHNIPEDMRFASCEELCEKPRLAPTVF